VIGSTLVLAVMTNLGMLVPIAEKARRSKSYFFVSLVKSISRGFICHFCQENAHLYRDDTFCYSPAEKWLKGAFPDELRLLEDLRFVSVYRNSGLAGEFPSVFRKLPKLEYLALHFCGIKGQLPDWLGEMTSLTSLVLSNNDFTGEPLR